MARKKNGHGAGIAAGLAVVAAGAAAAYFLYGKDGEKNRKKIKAWTLQAKGDVLTQMERMKELNQGAYNALVEKVGKRYAVLKHVDSKELQAFLREVKGHWAKIKKDIAPPKPRKRPASRKKTPR